MTIPAFYLKGVFGSCCIISRSCITSFLRLVTIPAFYLKGRGAILYGSWQCTDEDHVPV